MEQLDTKRITAEVAARHGVLLKEDDPALVLVTINEVVLVECFERLEERTRGLIAEIDACFEDIQQRASAHLTDEMRSAAAAVREEIHRDIQAAKLEASETVHRVRVAHSQSVVRRWVAVGVVCALALLVFGVMIGRMF
jgi:ElaB/YqjD/DUF883 family membrane-anchored ribosome-binding protein